MLTIICGEDSIASRDYFLKLKEDYRKKNYEIYQIPSGELLEIDRWLSDSPSLFMDKRIFFTENLNKKISKRNNPIFTGMVEKLIGAKDIQIIDWEEIVAARELKLVKNIIIKEFKPSQSIFKLQDACYPKNLKNFLNLLNELPDKTDDFFIFIMLTRHIRNLLTVKSGQSLSKLAPWQSAKLKSQAKHWSVDSLTAFYEGLYKIEVSVKTSRNPFSIKKSLELLACYVL